eukprot:XP_001702193.1 predicted protein [Chlamydomonas reinhardtii]
MAGSPTPPWWTAATRARRTCSSLRGLCRPRAGGSWTRRKGRRSWKPSSLAPPCSSAVRSSCWNTSGCNVWTPTACAAGPRALGRVSGSGLLLAQSRS